VKHIETVAVPATTREKVGRVTCDICGVEIKRKDAFDGNRVEMRCEKVTNYPEGAFGTVYDYDVCVPCFESKVMSFMESLSAMPRETEL